MKRTFPRALVAAFSIGCAGLAQAVPVYFDFTGKISGTDTAVSGGFNFETDRLLAYPPSPGSTQYTFVDWEPAGLTEPLAFLNFGDQSVSLPRYPSTYGLINFQDGCTSTPCPQFTSDWFDLFVESRDVQTADFTGTLHSSSLFFFDFMESTQPVYTGYDTLDGATSLPADILTLPLYNLLGIYSESTFDCVAGECVFGTNSQFNFSVDTVSRGEGARPVPEPGSIALFAAAALGAFVLRRRRPMKEMMKSIPVRGLAAALALGLAATANAVPIYFDFTGKITDTSTPAAAGVAPGVAISGGFTFESDRLIKSTYPENAQLTDFFDLDPTELTDPLAFVNFAGRTLTVPGYGFSNYSGIEYIDNCPTPTSCLPGLVENFSVFGASSEGYPDLDFTGTLRDTYIQIYSWRNPGSDFFDGSSVDPFTMVDLQLLNVMGFVSEGAWTCEHGDCRYDSTQFSFSVDTESRGVGPRPVPEPGTPGLFAAGLLGAFLLRRRLLPRG